MRTASPFSGPKNMASFVALSYAICALAVLMVTAFPRPLETVVESSSNLLRASDAESEERREDDQPDAYQSGQESGFTTERRKAVRNEARRWPDAIVPYDIQTSAASIASSARALIRSAMDYWESLTCLRFVPYDPKTHKDYLIIQKGTWCSSIPGRKGGWQPLNLALGCLKFGSIAHELGHAIGWVHEHARPDRDKYIEILWDKVKNADDKKQLDKYDESIINTYGVPYDYKSIMHYNGTAGTIRALDPKQQSVMGQRERLSFNDVKLANIMYKCAERNKCNLDAVTCASEGYVGPNCTCVCPDGTVSCSTKVFTPKELPTIIPEKCSEWTISKTFRKFGQSGTRIFGVDVEECKERCRNAEEFICLSADYRASSRICYINPDSQPGEAGDFQVTHYERDLGCGGDTNNAEEEEELAKELEVVD